MIYKLLNGKTKKKRLLANFDEDNSVFRVCSGSECVFVQYESKSALKLYETRKEAKEAYLTQKAAFIDDIAPACFGGIVRYYISKAFWNRYTSGADNRIPYITYPKNGIMYGYYTEVVTTAKTSEAEDDNFKNHFSSKAAYSKCLKSLQKRFSKTKRKLYNLTDTQVSKLEYDLDLRNIGWRDDGSVVIIDFGSISTNQ